MIKQITEADIREFAQEAWHAVKDMALKKLGPEVKEEEFLALVSNAALVILAECVVHTTGDRERAARLIADYVKLNLSEAIDIGREIDAEENKERLH